MSRMIDNCVYGNNGDFTYCGERSYYVPYSPYLPVVTIQENLMEKINQLVEARLLEIIDKIAINIDANLVLSSITNSQIDEIVDS